MQSFHSYTHTHTLAIQMQICNTLVLTASPLGPSGPIRPGSPGGPWKDKNMISNTHKYAHISIHIQIQL